MSQYSSVGRPSEDERRACGDDRKDEEDGERIDDFDGAEEAALAVDESMVTSSTCFGLWLVGTLNCCAAGRPSVVALPIGPIYTGLIPDCVVVINHPNFETQSEYKNPTN